ncbi:hypothetical protein BJV82DRAFT_674520 [Fennellomyces sp. T-0311]|nr:hypothetical protein BJV82DRAFT_674520 [Fennellomyces sp. T-0311]
MVLSDITPEQEVSPVLTGPPPTTQSQNQHSPQSQQSIHTMDFENSQLTPDTVSTPVYNTYAAVVARNGRSSQKKGPLFTPLEHFASDENKAKTQPNPSTGDAISPHLLRRGTEDYSVFYDASSPAVAEDAFLKAARQLFPNWDVGIGMIPHKDKETGHQLYEMTLPNEAACSIALQQCLKIENQEYHAVRSLPPDHFLTKLELEKIPTCLPTMELEKCLREALSPYGEVVNLGLYRAKKGWFQGFGYAVLMNTQGTSSLGELKHRVPFGKIGNREREFYAKWKGMGKYCTYCRDDGHSIVECETRPSQMPECYNCRQVGHISINCPHPPSAHHHKKPKSSSNAQQPLKAPVKPFTVKPTAQSPIQSTTGSSASKHATRAVTDEKLNSNKEAEQASVKENVIRIPTDTWQTVRHKPKSGNKKHGSQKRKRSKKPEKTPTIALLQAVVDAYKSRDDDDYVPLSGSEASNESSEESDSDDTMEDAQSGNVSSPQGKDPSRDKGEGEGDIDPQ